MDSSREGLEGGGPPRRLKRTLTASALNDVMDPEVVPSSLAVIAPILHVANEVEDTNPRIAYLCRFYAFDKAHKIDPSSAGRGVRQFKTALLHKLEKDDDVTLEKRKAKSDPREMQTFYQEYYDKHVKSLENNTGAMDRAHLARTYQTAAVLFDVLKSVNQTGLDPQMEAAAKEVEAKKEIYVAFNILPLDPISGSKAIMTVPEVNNHDEEFRSEGTDDSLVKMKAVEDDIKEKQKSKDKPSFEYSGKLAAETNKVRGVTLQFTEPPEARKPTVRWRLYIFKDGEPLNEPLYIHRLSCYLFGRERRVADVPTDHPSCSKQHSVIQYRLVDVEGVDGLRKSEVRPYLMDLKSTNGTFLNGERIEAERYYELFEKDTIKFGNSSREYVLLHEQSAD